MQVEKTGGLRLRLDTISLWFGGVTALTDVSLDVRENEILAIIGPNGSGKSCILNCISGLYKPQKGEIYFDGRRITRMRPDQVAKLRVARTFQNIGLFLGLTTLDNIMVGQHVQMRPGLLTPLYFGKEPRSEIKHRRIAEGIIDFLKIESIRNKPVGVLPYGLRKKVELGRALALQPKILLLDEPMAGMNFEEKEDFVRLIIELFERQGSRYSDIPVLRDGIKCIVLIEHDMGVVMNIADRIVVLDYGSKIADGKPDEIRSNADVIRAYLGS